MKIKIGGGFKYLCISYIYIYTSYIYIHIYCLFSPILWENIIYIYTFFVYFHPYYGRRLYIYTHFLFIFTHIMGEDYIYTHFLFIFTHIIGRRFNSLMFDSYKISIFWKKNHHLTTPRPTTLAPPEGCLEERFTLLHLGLFSSHRDG